MPKKTSQNRIVEINVPMGLDAVALLGDIDTAAWNIYLLVNEAKRVGRHSADSLRTIDEPTMLDIVDASLGYSPDYACRLFRKYSGVLWNYLPANRTHAVRRLEPTGPARLCAKWGVTPRCSLRVKTKDMHKRRGEQHLRAEIYYRARLWLCSRKSEAGWIQVPTSREWIAERLGVDERKQQRYDALSPKCRRPKPQYLIIKLFPTREIAVDALKRMNERSGLSGGGIMYEAHDRTVVKRIANIYPSKYAPSEDGWTFGVRKRTRTLSRQIGPSHICPAVAKPVQSREYAYKPEHTSRTQHVRGCYWGTRVPGYGEASSAGILDPRSVPMVLAEACGGTVLAVLDDGALGSVDDIGLSSASWHERLMREKRHHDGGVPMKEILARPTIFERLGRGWMDCTLRSKRSRAGIRDPTR